MSEELKPCPCCDGDATLIPYATPKGIRFYIQCDTCSLRTAHFSTEEQAITAWGTRAASEPSEAMVEAAAREEMALDWACPFEDADEDVREDYLRRSRSILKAALAQPASEAKPDALEGLDLAAINDAWRLIQMTYLNMRLLGLKDRGDDLSLKHELREMAWTFSNKDEPEHGFPKGTGKAREVMQRLKALYDALAALAKEPKP